MTDGQFTVYTPPVYQWRWQHSAQPLKTHKKKRSVLGQPPRQCNVLPHITSPRSELVARCHVLIHLVGPSGYCIGVIPVDLVSVRPVQYALTHGNWQPLTILSENVDIRPRYLLQEWVLPDGLLSIKA